MRPDHKTGSSMPYSLWIVCGFFYVPLGCEHWRVVRRGLRFIVLIREDLKVLTICGCNYKGSTFSSVILRPWVLVRPEWNSRPPAWQPDAQPTEPPVRVFRFLLLSGNNPWVILTVKLFNFVAELNDYFSFFLWIVSSFSELVLFSFTKWSYFCRRNKWLYHPRTAGSQTRHWDTCAR